MKKIKVLLGLATIMCIGLVGCKSNQNIEQTNEISVIEGKFSIDVNSYEELAGDADYVIIGKVLEETGTEYRHYVTLENGKRSGTPYTNYVVQVIENLKGNLMKETPINIIKQGGMREDGTGYELFTDDLLPIQGQTYVFYIYAQSEKSELGAGKNLVCGPNSTIPVTDGQRTEITTRLVTDKSSADVEELMDKIRKGVTNQIKSDRERAVSNDDVSVE